MTDVIIPITTVWDVVANALDDTGFWIISALGMIAIALFIRNRIGRRWTACPCRP